MLKICFLGDVRTVHLRKWARYLRDTNYDVSILSLRPGSLRGVRVYDLKPPPLLSKVGYLFTIPRVRKLLVDINPDILHAFHATSYGFLGAASGFHPFVISSWGSDALLFPKKSIFHKLLLTWSLSRANRITATGGFLRGAVEMLVRERKIDKIPIGVDINLFKPRKGGKRRKFTIVTVRNLERIYGLRYLIDAFASFSRDKSEVELKIIGDGSIKKRLIDQVSKLGLGKKVRFLGRLPQARVAEELVKSDVFVIPSLSESFGVAALEASASGIPVIASNVGGLPEVVKDGKTGFLVESKNPTAIADKLELLFKDVNLRRELSKAGRDFVAKNYSWDVSVDKMNKLYGSLI